MTCYSRIAWQMPREQFAYMAQQLVENVLDEVHEQRRSTGTSIGDVAFAGGHILERQGQHADKEARQLKHWYIFPHMGDGGIALGAALYANYLLNGTTDYAVQRLPWRTAIHAEETEEALKRQVAQVRGQKARQTMQACGRADSAGQLPILVPGQDGVRAEGAGQQEHTRAKRLGGGQGEAEPLCQEEGMVPAVCAIDAGGGSGAHARVRRARASTSS